MGALSLVCAAVLMGCGDEPPPTSSQQTLCGLIPEACDGLDNDCDGEIDEELGTLKCGLGACARVIDFCRHGQVQRCVPFERVTAEVCDGLDNDCDGEIDEDLDRLVCGLGVCRHTEPACVDGVAGTCDPLAGLSDEICDGLDNDCDGEVDELPDITCGLGPCAITVEACIAGVPRTCEPRQIATREICDGLDNDCNGVVDDPFPEVGLPCQDGLGVCASAGVFVCDPDGTVRCDAPIAFPEPEVCDGRDDDCNGHVDDVEPVVCGLGQCRHVLRCRGGQLPECAPFTGATVEVCDGLDNDCDGLVDRASDGSQLLMGCYTASPLTMDHGLCHPGVRVCVDSELSDGCLDQHTPQIEVADGLDNDCNGVVDDVDSPPEAMVLLPGAPAFAMGTSAVDVLRLCADATPTAARSLMAEALADLVELCANGVDDDCDGTTDEVLCEPCDGDSCLPTHVDCPAELAAGDLRYSELLVEYRDTTCPALYADQPNVPRAAAPFAGQCAVDAQCQAGRQCRFGRCAESPRCGGPAQCAPDEDCVEGHCVGGPDPRTVSVEPFFLDATEVSVADYAACVGAGQCTPDPEALESPCNYGADSDGEVCQDRATLPMNCVSAAMADQYCRALHKRLPTSAEWELAAAGPGCLADPQCPEGQRCVFGECRLAEACDLGCDPAEEVCVEGLCVRSDSVRRLYPWGSGSPSCLATTLALDGCDDAIPSRSPPGVVPCPDGEILALDGGQYHCRNRLTCGPTGVPECVNDGECVAGQRCCQTGQQACSGDDPGLAWCGCDLAPAADRCAPRCAIDDRLGCRTGGPRSVGTSPDDRTPEGIYDLGGNVSEWVTGGDPRAGFEARGASFADSDPREMAVGASPPRAAVMMGFRCALSGPP